MTKAELRTARLLLRPFRPEDVDDSLAYRNDPEFAKYLPHVPQPFTRADAEAFVRLNMEEPWDTLPTFAIVLDDHVIGTVNIEVDHPSRTAMVGYAIARAHWRRGIATEAARAVVEWAFVEHAVDEIWASSDARHVRSVRVMEKLGMTPASKAAKPDQVRYCVKRSSYGHTETIKRPALPPSRE